MMLRFRNRRPTSSYATIAAPAKTFERAGPSSTERAPFAAGCFWGVEAAFRKIEGVLQSDVGYTGGHTEHPTYRDVCSHRTGHAEAVEIWSDPAQVGYEELLATFWQIPNPHDP